MNLIMSKCKGNTLFLSILPFTGEDKTTNNKVRGAGIGEDRIKREFIVPRQI